MNISKRTIIIFVVGLVVIVGAFFSLYMEKEAEIKDLEQVDPEPQTRKPKKSQEAKPDLHIVEEPIITEGNGTETN